MNDAGDEPIPDDDVVITVPADQQAGVWSNWAAINESDNAFSESCTNPHRGRQVSGGCVVRQSSEFVHLIGLFRAARIAVRNSRL